MPLTGLDFILILVMLVSGILAMIRGFTREVLSILSWAVAAVGTVALYPRFRSDVRDMIQPDLLADGILIAGLFIAILILVSFITIRLSDIVLDSKVGALDRTLGFAFGLARGLLLVVVGFIFLNWLIQEDDQPQWIADARSKPLLEDTSNYIMSLLPEDPERALMERGLPGFGSGSEPAGGNGAGNDTGAGGTGQQ